MPIQRQYAHLRYRRQRICLLSKPSTASYILYHSGRHSTSSIYARSKLFHIQRCMSSPQHVKQPFIDMLLHPVTTHHHSSVSQSTNNPKPHWLAPIISPTSDLAIAYSAPADIMLSAHCVLLTLLPSMLSIRHRRTTVPQVVALRW